MALYYTLPVYKDTYKLIMSLMRLTKEFPREYKYSLGEDIRRDGMELVRHIYRANSGAGSVRSEALVRFSDDFELLRLELRVAFDLRILSPAGMAEVTELMETIGKQIAGWRKAASATTEQNGRG